MKRMSPIHVVCMAVFFAMTVVSQSFCEKQVELRFMWWGNDSRHKATIDAIKLFEQKYPNIKVKAEYSGWTGYNEKLTTSFMGKNAADLLMVNWNMLYMLGAENYYDLKKAGVDLSKYPQNLIKQCTIDGKVVGVPNSSNGRLFFYNKTTYDKAGVAIPKSFTDLINAAAAFKTKLGAGYYPILLGDYDAWLLTLMYCEQKYGKPFIVNNKVAYTVDELKSGLDFYSALVAKGVCPSIAETQTAGVVPFDQDQRWITGKFAGLYDWSATSSKIKGSAADGQIVVGETPKDFGKKPGCVYKISHCYAIYGNTKHPKETAMLLTFLHTNPEAVKVQKLERGVPSNIVGEGILQQAGLLTGLGYEAQKMADKSAGMGISPRFEDPEIQKYYREEVMQQLENTGSKVAAEKAIKKTNEYLKEAAEE